MIQLWLCLCSVISWNYCVFAAFGLLEMSHQADQVPVRSEDECGRKWDRCISNSMLKVGGGLGLGALFSLLFFKRRGWPVLLGTGMGLGMSYSNCQHELQNPYCARPQRKKQLAISPPPVASVKPVEKAT